MGSWFMYRLAVTAQGGSGKRLMGFSRGDARRRAIEEAVFRSKVHGVTCRIDRVASDGRTVYVGSAYGGEFTDAVTGTVTL